MLDFSFGELVVIGAVALVALGPERLPKVARSVGQWVGKAQSYVTQVKADIDREVQLSEIRALTEQARNAAASAEHSLRAAVETARTEVGHIGGDGTSPGSNQGWSSGEADGPRFARRYRPRPTLDDLVREIEQLRRGGAHAAPGAAPGSRRSKYAPRARLNRVRVRR